MAACMCHFTCWSTDRPRDLSHGEDIDEHGNGMLPEPRLYQLIRQPGQITDRTFEITFAGAQVFAFTFGQASDGELRSLH